MVTMKKKTAATTGASVAQRPVLAGKAPRHFGAGKAPRMASQQPPPQQQQQRDQEEEEQDADAYSDDGVAEAVQKVKNAKNATANELAAALETIEAAATDSDVAASFAELKKIAAAKNKALRAAANGVKEPKAAAKKKAATGAGQKVSATKAADTSQSVTVQKMKRKYSPSAKRRGDPSANVRRQAKRLAESARSMMRRRPFTRLLRHEAAALTDKKVRMRPEFVDMMLEATESFGNKVMNSATIVAMCSRGVKTVKPEDIAVVYYILRNWDVKAIMDLEIDESLFLSPRKPRAGRKTGNSAAAAAAASAKPKKPRAPRKRTKPTVAESLAADPEQQQETAEAADVDAEEQNGGAAVADEEMIDVIPGASATRSAQDYGLGDDF